MSGPEQAPTRAAVLALQDERTVVAEAYDFLDEKRLLLAAELLRQLGLYEQLQAEIQALTGKVKQRLAAAIRRHGLQGLGVYPATQLEGIQLGLARGNFMGVTLVNAELIFPATEGSGALPASYPSPEAEACRGICLEILQKSATLAELSGNLHRLLHEYRLTERRARALENVILPEIEQSLGEMLVHIEEMDLEDVIRARLHGHATDSAR